jgi:hypothetical protein
MTDWKTLLISSAPDAVLGEEIATAIEQLFASDAALLIRDVHERTIAARLADHLRPRFSEWHVDCEYNRDGHEIKKVDGIIVVPDIIIHRRGTTENLLVIEVKKSNTRVPDEQDIEKIHGFRESHLRYQYAIFLKLIVGEDAPGVERIYWA